MAKGFYFNYFVVPLGSFLAITFAFVPRALFVIQLGLLPEPTVAGKTAEDEMPEQVEANEAEEDSAPYVLVSSKRGEVMRLHFGSGCWHARTLSFREFELCDLDPVPPNLYDEYRRACWPVVFTAGGSESGDSPSATSTSAMPSL